MTVPSNIDSASRQASSSDGDNNGSQSSQNGKKKTRSVTFSLGKENPPSPSVSDTSSARRVSARAERSMRRQAKIETDPTKKGSNTNKKLSFKRRIDMKRNSINSSSNSKKNGGKDDEVVKVKLNTGTLYLYKGSVRRAVFVRRL